MFQNIRKKCYKDIISKPIVIIVGMHRSGTGLLTQILQSLGVFMGAVLSRNKESLFFQAINKDILDYLGCNWRHIAPLPEPRALLDHHKEVFVVANKRVKNGLVTDHFRLDSFNLLLRKTPPIWGWKDPRNSLLIPIWKEVFPAAKIVHIYRNGRDVALSLIRREIKLSSGKVPFNQSQFCERYIEYFSLWEKYIYHILESSKFTSTWHNLAYEDLLQDSSREITKLSDFLQISNKELNANAVSLIDVNREVKHFGYQNQWIKEACIPSKTLEKLGYPH